MKNPFREDALVHGATVVAVLVASGLGLWFFLRTEGAPYKAPSAPVERAAPVFDPRMDLAPMGLGGVEYRRQAATYR